MKKQAKVDPQLAEVRRKNMIGVVARNERAAAARASKEVEIAVPKPRRAMYKPLGRNITRTLAMDIAQEELVRSFAEQHQATFSWAARRLLALGLEAAQVTVKPPA